MCLAATTEGAQRLRFGRAALFREEPFRKFALVLIEYLQGIGGATGDMAKWVDWTVPTLN